MKKIAYLLLISLSFVACNPNKDKQPKTDEHSAEYALNYEGVYKGTYPCADCSGIQVSLTLNTDKTFRYETVYLGKKDGRFVHKGNYTIKENILTIQENDQPIHFAVGESALTLLGNDLKPNTGELASFYLLKKQKKFDYQGQYETYNDKKGEYFQRLSIQPKEKNYEVVFSASKVKDKENCHFSGIGNIKNDTLWVNIAHEDNKEILMYIAPSHDNLGVEVFTKNFEERAKMMFYCSGGSSLAGQYIKNEVTANSIGRFTNQNTIAEVLQTLPNAQIEKKIGHGEFKEDVYDDYQIFGTNSQPLFTVTPKDTADVHQKINRVLIHTPFFRTDKGINSKSTYGDIKNAYTITKIEPTREHIVLIVNEMNANFSIAKTKLQEGWWNEETKSVNEDKIPVDAQVDSFILWWKEAKK
ncbi:MAG: hypothetical protein CSA38_04470 [Flavobacteriales bacterium]|nr:MAG: hypothetical protein CSA38_04470 [Flavobacteriales bacterium]